MFFPGPLAGDAGNIEGDGQEENAARIIAIHNGGC
jgi:hypothetical protein